MPTDLKTVRDHPALFLNQCAADAYERSEALRRRRSSETDDDGSVDASYGESYSRSSTRLRAYEIENGVTFAALDNDALAEVREAYAEFQDARGDHEYRGGVRIADAINSLLGLDDA